MGVSANKKGQKFAYYACVSRLRKLGCNLDYIRAQDLEKEIVATIRELFQGEDMLERIWQETDRLLAAERPEVDAELAKIGRDLATATETRDRYFSSFEAGTLSPAECGPRLEAINALLRALQDRQSELEAARTRLALPALDRDAVAALMGEFETVFESGTNGQRKHLLQLLVKKVIVHSRDRAEAWFAFPEPGGPRSEPASATSSGAASRNGQSRRGVNGQLLQPTGPPIRALVQVPAQRESPEAPASWALGSHGYPRIVRQVPRLERPHLG